MNIDKCIGLTGFAPLIQIWAGICLLFFYESILEKSPLDKHIQRLGELYNAFFNKYQGDLGLEDRPEHDVTNWKNFLPAIKNMAALSFFYSIFMLGYIGIESSYTDYYHAFPMMNILVLLYLVLCVLFSSYCLFHTYWTPIAYIGLIIVYFHCYSDINKFLSNYDMNYGTSLSETVITVQTMFTFFSGLVVILLRFIYDFFYIKYKSSRIRALNGNFDQMWNVKMGRMDYKDLPAELQQKMSKKAGKEFNEKGEVPKDAIKRFINEEIAEEYESFTKPWYKRIKLNNA